MLRTDFVMKLMSVILFIAVAAYIGIYIYNTAKNPLKTEAVARYTVEESGKAEGYAVRNETVLDGEDGVAALMAGEGEKLGAGQAVAVYYEGESALERASEIRVLQLQIKDARAGLAASVTLNASDTEDCILAFSDAVQHQAFDRLQDLSYSVKNDVFTSSSGKLSEEDLELLELRLDNLLGEDSGTQTVTAPVSGVFTSAIDGYEGFAPDDLIDLTPSSLTAMFSGGQSQTDGALGKLITGIACITPPSWTATTPQSWKPARRRRSSLRKRILKAWI
jgi:hypothetical protein